MHRRSLLVILALGLSATLAQADKIFTGIEEGVALGGYDAVSYFKQAEPMKGSAEFTAEHAGVKWHFADAANLEAFKASPEKYAPQYGGHCAYAAAKGYIASGDPLAHTVHEGKLYINYSPSVRTTWLKDVPGYISKGDANWPELSKE